MQTEDDESESWRSEGEGSTFFRDGRRKVDFVLVYETSEVTPANDKKALRQESSRQRFMNNLVKAGLDVEQVPLTNFTGEQINDYNIYGFFYLLSLPVLWPIKNHRLGCSGLWLE